MSAVIVAKYLSPFEKFVPSQHVFEIVPSDEVVTLAILFGAAPRSRGVGNRKVEIRNGRQQARNQRGFPGTGGSGDDEYGGHVEVFGRKILGQNFGQRSDKRVLFQVEALLTDFIDLALRAERQIRHGQPQISQPARFGQHGIRFPIHLL
jgi:hypothetical protein